MPLKNPELLWLIVPVWLNWILTEYFQERRGTSFGNAIANGFVMFWVGLDFSRTIVNNFAQKGFSAISLTHVGMTAIILTYGSLIMFEAIKGRKIAHLIGRIREVTYFSTIAIGVIYNAVVLDVHTIISMAAFFPIFYITTEIFLRLMPTPSEELIEELEEEERELKHQPKQVKQSVEYQTKYLELMKKKAMLMKRK
jgi:low temperature requirement protein LtrA